MKRLIALVLSFILLFSFSLSEDVDWSSISYDEWADYILTLSMQDSLVLMDKMGLDPGEVFQQAYDQGLQEFGTLYDNALFLSYAAMHKIMEDRDLMKYLPILGIEPASSTETDLSKMTFDELSSLRSEILMEMMARSDWQEVDVQAGTYLVGVDIPSGHWTITCAPRNYCYVTVGATLEDNKKEIVYGAKGYYHIAMAGTESGISDRGYPSSVDLELTEGMYVCIERAYVTFTPYTGTTGFVFK